jgi:hypothetical protein
MPEIDKPNPHEEPNLRSAWEEGWKAFQEEKPPLGGNLFDDPEETEAYLDGYLAAQDHEEKHEWE